jgi:hypothetical protein
MLTTSVDPPPVIGADARERYREVTDTENLSTLDGTPGSDGAPPIAGRWWEFAADQALTEALTRFLCLREGRVYVPQGAGGHPAGSVEGVRIVARDFLQNDVLRMLIDRAQAPCSFVDGPCDDWSRLTVCPEPRAESGRSLYCREHAARVRAGDRGVPYARESVVEYRAARHG